MEAARARVAFADSKKNRQEVLSHQRFASSRTLQEACTERKLGESELSVAGKNQNLAEPEVTHTQELLCLHPVRSPIDGVVVQPGLRGREVGYFERQGTDPQDCRGRSAKRRGGATHYAVSRDHPQQPWVWQVGGSAEGVFFGTALDVAAATDPASGTFGERLELVNPNHINPAGLNAKCGS